MNTFDCDWAFWAIALALMFFLLWVWTVSDLMKWRGSPIDLETLPRGTVIKLVELPQEVRYVTYLNGKKMETKLVKFPTPFNWPDGQELIVDKTSNEVRIINHIRPCGNSIPTQRP